MNEKIYNSLLDIKNICSKYSHCAEGCPFADGSVCGIINHQPDMWELNRFHPKDKMYFKEYKERELKEIIPTCHCGYTDCVLDPAYLLESDPHKYKKKYGDKEPHKVRCTCCNSYFNGERLICLNYENKEGE